MRNVIFVAPFFVETTLRFVSAAAHLPGIRFGLVSQDPESRLPEGIRRHLSGHYRVDDALTAHGILKGVEALRDHFGGSVDRLLGTLEELQVPLGELRDHLGIPGMGAEAARNFRDKARMKSVLRAHGLPCAAHGVGASPDEVRHVSRRIGFPLIVKPPEGSGARATFRVESADELEGVIRSIPPTADRPHLLEEFVVGEEHSFDAFSVGGRIVSWSVTDYEPSPLEVLREPWIQWCVLLPREKESPRYAGIRQVAGRALDVLGMHTGMSHMEWFLRPDGTVAISEVGARPPGARFTSLVSHAFDMDVFDAWARLMVFDEAAPRPQPYAAGAAYLRGQGKGTVKAVEGLDDVLRELAPLVAEVRAPRAGQSPSGTYEGEGFVILRHPETDAVREGLRQIVRRTRVVLG